MENIRPANFWRYQLPALVWAVFIFTLSSIPATMVPFSPPLGLDKAFHVSIFFVFGLLLNRAFRFQSRLPLLSSHHLVLSLVIVASYGFLDELHQTVVPGRSPDYADALADAAGGLLSTAYLFVRQKISARREIGLP